MYYVPVDCQLRSNPPQGLLALQEPLEEFSSDDDEDYTSNADESAPSSSENEKKLSSTRTVPKLRQWKLRSAFLTIRREWEMGTDPFGITYLLLNIWVVAAPWVPCSNYARTFEKCTTVYSCDLRYNCSFCSPSLRNGGARLPIISRDERVFVDKYFEPCGIQFAVKHLIMVPRVPCSNIARTLVEVHSFQLR
jgi:hypothetical protein